MKHPLALLGCLIVLSGTLLAEETILDTAPVPNRLLRQGDARLIRRGATLGVSIDLNTRHLKRVRDKILESETANWPESPASQRYRQTLQTVTDTLLEKQDGKIAFRVDWFLSPDGTGRIFVGNDQHHTVLEDLPADYLRKNLILILQDRFDLSPEEAQTLLETHLP